MGNYPVILIYGAEVVIPSHYVFGVWSGEKRDVTVNVEGHATCMVEGDVLWVCS